MNNVNEFVIRYGGKLEVVGYVDGCVKYWGIWIVFWGQCDLKKRKIYIEYCINFFIFLFFFEVMWLVVGLGQLC